MTIPNTTTTQPTMADVQAAAAFLKRGQPYYLLDMLSESGLGMRMHGTGTVKFRRYERMAAITTALTEGVTPGGQQFVPTDITATLSRYGGWAPVTTEVLDLNDDQPQAIREYTGVMSEQGSESMERIGWSTVVGGTQVTYQNGTARTDVNTAPTRTKLRAICATLDGNLARPITSIRPSSQNYNSVSIEPSYIGVAHTDASWRAFRDVDGFKSHSDYPSGAKKHESEFGTVEGMRFCKTQLIPKYIDGGGAKGAMQSTGGTSADVYVTMVFARECFGTVPLKGRQSITVNWRPPMVSHATPLASWGFASWATYRTHVRLNEAWLHRWEHAIPA
ncbi:MAG TPA: N4-gp56 family major capsid protein [Longimicrobiales bacterium]|nr:N4-gp56 family major capsid protein [Longimicrobiales bacterium]